MNKTEHMETEMKVEFTAYNKPMELITLAEAKECLQTIMPSADIKKFEKKLSEGMYLGYNDNFFRLRKRKDLKL